ncbi:MAG TPA: CHC2 zinc finger domain-containing protein [Terriglobales bacterium]|nr:CHC2 zinc finger domain-containing protein [Terriglobales bacterium]
MNRHRRAASGIDTDALRRQADLAAVIGARIALARHGGEWQGLCPFHTEKTPSFTVNPAKGFYHCFGCGAHGDVIRFIQDFHRLDFRAACMLLGAGDTGTSSPHRDNTTAPPPPADSPTDIYAGLQPADPGDRLPAIGVPLRCWNPKNPAHPWVTYRPSAVHPYHTADGRLLGCVLRIDLPERATPKGLQPARKITPTIRFARFADGAPEPGPLRSAGQREAWCHWPFDKPRPLYRLPDLAAHPDHQVLVVEGEKAADAARRLFHALPIVVTTWPGGAKAMRHVDWSPLAGRDVLLWGDADAPGEAAMLGSADSAGRTVDGVAQLCQRIGTKQIRYLPWDHDRPRGWDTADAEAENWQIGDLMAWLTGRLRDWSPLLAIDGPATSVRTTSSASHDNPPCDAAGRSDDAATETPFRILGHHRGSYFYLPEATQQMVTLTAAAHTRPHLLTLAPLAYWARHHPGRNGFDLEAASDALIGAAHRTGLFTPERLRGRGAWREDGRVVMHTGRQLYVDGKACRPAALAGSFIYEAAPDLTETITPALGQAPSQVSCLPPAATTTEAARLVEICRRLSWENPLSADLLAGWCVIAPLCGALDWRPHLWITGPAQAGKSTVIRDIIRRVIGIFALYVDGKTTEAGIRQLLGADARPIILDEFESEDPAAAARVQQILDMARVSSSGGTVVKGSTAGRPMTYTIRACFCFSSINTAVTHYADETRISKLVLRRNEAADADRQHRALMADITAWFTPDYALRLLRRALDHLPVLLGNVATFTQAAAHLLRSRRAADQIGTMLAGLFLCHSTAAISPDEAEAWIKARDWHDHAALDAISDERRLLERIATRRLRVPMAGGHREVTIGQAIMAVHDQPESYGDWAAELGAHGIRVDGAEMLIANTASPLKRLLEGSPWAGDWLRPLRMLPGASAAPYTYFSPGLKSRATRLPVSLLAKEPGA